jgi:hypothetical protein
MLPAWPMEPVRAQGFSQQQGHAPPPQRLYGYRGVQPRRALHSWSSPDWSGRGAVDAWVGPRITYRTLCVRLCDGFYFPISNATSGSGLARDADRCAASCSVEARLYYHENPGGGVDGMVDLTGLAYSSLPNAFKYRKALVQGCQCRPQPWSEAEQQRHRGYAGGGRPVPEAAR